MVSIDTLKSSFSLSSFSFSTHVIVLELELEPLGSSSLPSPEYHAYRNTASLESSAVGPRLKSCE